MKLQELLCPNCNAPIKMEMRENQKFVFCPYCGAQLVVDDENKNYTVTKNVVINKHIADDTKIAEAKYEDKKDRRATIAICFLLVICFSFLGLMLLGSEIEEKKAEEEIRIAIEEGKIQAGYYDDLIGEDYKTVEAHFKAAGFTNIELIDLKDSGVAFWDNEKVETISVGGNTSFDETDYFDPDTKVIISYH